MSKPVSKPSLLHLSVEEENLAAIPFAVLERRVGKRIGKLEIQGTKMLPDGTEVHVSWQVQGNTELGLPTEQDLGYLRSLWDRSHSRIILPRRLHSAAGRSQKYSAFTAYTGSFING